MISKKVSRRQAIKTFAAAGALFIAQPYLPRVSNRGEVEFNPELAPGIKDALVVLVRDGELTGFWGFEELSIKDHEMASRLYSRFQRKLGERGL